MSVYLQGQVHDLKIRVRKLEHILEIEDAKKDGVRIKELKELREQQKAEISALEDGP